MSQLYSSDGSGKSRNKCATLRPPSNQATKQPSNQPSMSSTFQSGAVLKSVFGDALEKYTSGLLTAVCADYELNFEEVSARYMDGNFLQKARTPKEPKPRAPKQEKKPCSGLTSKGGPCKFAALGDSDLCGIHQRKLEGGDPKPKAEKVPKEPKKPKQKKQDPKHTHPLTEEGEDCELCESHGNVMDKKVTETKFEAVTEDEVSIKDRLKAILAVSDDEEPEPEPEKTEPVPEPKPDPKPLDEAGPSEPKPKAKASGFIRPKVKGKKVAAPVKKPEPEPEPTMDEAESIRSKLKAILANTEDDSEDEVDMEDTKDRLTMKLASKFDEDPDEMDIGQMCDTPDSQAQLRQAWAEMTLEEEEEEE